MFAAQGLLVLDASGREAHRLGAPVLRGAIERADELHEALLLCGLMTRVELERCGGNSTVWLENLVEQKRAGRFILAANVAAPSRELWIAAERLQWCKPFTRPVKFIRR